MTIGKRNKSSFTLAAFVALQLLGAACGGAAKQTNTQTGPGPNVTGGQQNNNGSESQPSR